jgi:hypothetical protein
MGCVNLLVVTGPMSLLVYARTPVQQLASYIGKSKRLRESYKRLARKYVRHTLPLHRKRKNG